MKIKYVISPDKRKTVQLHALSNGEYFTLTNNCAGSVYQLLYTECEGDKEVHVIQNTDNKSVQEVPFETECFPLEIESSSTVNNIIKINFKFRNI